MPQNDDPTTNGPLDDVERTDTGLPGESLGDADVKIDVDASTYERLRAEYRHATEQGYSHGFDTYAYNYCSVDHCVTVDGEPVDPDTQP
jgi:hypothetical protein